MAFAQVYECPKCGDVWSVDMVEQIDCDRDDVWTEPFCRKCKSSVREKFVEHNGNLVPVWHPLTDEEIVDETTDYSDPDQW